jgi:serine/threonine-protein kinase RsbW
MRQMSEAIVLRIPADTAHVMLLRAAASALAARLDFTIDRIMELQIAVDEACARLIAVSAAPTRIEMQLRMQDDAISLVASVDGGRREDHELLSDWSRVILEAIAEGVAPHYDGDVTSLALQVEKAGR